MNITPINLYPYNSNLHQQPSFNGISKMMRHSIFIDGKKDALQALAKRKDKNTRVGELPGFIFYRLPKENRPEIINEIMTTFEECANEIRNFKASAYAPTSESRNRRSQATVDKLKAVFEKYNLIDEPDKFDLEFLGAGEYKKAFRINGVKDKETGEQMCFKVFHIVDTTPEWHKYKCHGNYSEINIAMYWKKNVGPYTHRNKFYFGDINNGYLVDRFIEPKAEGPQKTFDEYDYGIKIVDEVKEDVGHNKIAGYSIDEGGSRVVNIVKNQSKTARYVLKHLKETPKQDRYKEWYNVLENFKHLDDTQRKAGLALSIKHMPKEHQEELIQKCLSFNKPLVDQSIAYALKYMPEDRAIKYFSILMKREHPKTQTVLLNEIPLLSKKPCLVKKDDIDTPRMEIDPSTIEMYYQIAAKHVLPCVEEHLASYIHLLPKDKIIPAAKILVDKHNYDINDRLLHKAKFIDNDQYSYSDKMTVIAMVKESTDNEFLRKKADEIRIKLIRDTLGDD